MKKNGLAIKFLKIQKAEGVANLNLLFLLQIQIAF